ncbi:MAG TPA: AbgT family transporter [Phycisphaerales bacterium]|nr:AbgT family transporter [Phycisphaerales bacterium]
MSDLPRTESSFLASSPSPSPVRRGVLDWIEWIGNKLPDPATLFLLGTLLVMALSHIGHVQGWTVMESLPKPVMEEVVGADGEVIMREVLDPATNKPQIVWKETGNQFSAKSLLTKDGFFWAIKSMVKNFVDFPPLGIVLVGMLGIGIAERTGMIGAGLKAFMLVVPSFLLTPAMVFIGIMSSLATDAGYVVLPPLAAALYKSVGRSPLAGLAAVFAGVSAGFNANLLITGLDPMLAGFTETGARVIEHDYPVNPACNWWFMMASTVLITLTGWAVTSWFVEKRLSMKPPEEGGPLRPSADDLVQQRLTPTEIKGLTAAFFAFVITFGSFLFLIFWSDGALHGQGERFARWAESIVPMLFFVFIIPGIAFGIATKKFRNDKDVARMLIDTMAAMAPIIVLAFFAAQFIEYFKYSGLDRMLAMAGGQALGHAQMSPGMLIVAFIMLTLVFNLFMGSMSAKYAMFAPIFVPMFMMVGIAPELTQAAYRIGDSTSNIITPLNAYLIIILVFMQKFVPKGGMGTLISTMLPYTIVFTIVWTVFLLLWMQTGQPLGVNGELWYDPAAASAVTP